MVRRLLASALLLSLLGAGCGGGNSSMNGPVPNNPLALLNGNFALTAVSQMVTNTAFIGGNVQTDSSGQFSGVLHVQESNSNCFAVTTDVSFTGNIRGLTLTATSASVNGQVIMVNAMISSDGKSITSGSYSISGGCAGGDHGTITGFQMQAFTGNYVGGFNVGHGILSFAIPLTQVTIADGHGEFRFNNTIAETVDANTGCGFGSFGASLMTDSAFAAGSVLVLKLNVFDGSATIVATITFVGVATDSSAKSVSGTFAITSGLCSGLSGTGTLSHL